MRKNSVRFLLLCALVPGFFLPRTDSKPFRARVVEHTLKNGLKFLILPRHDAPWSLFTPSQCRRRERESRDHGPRAHFRAPGLQGNDRHR